MILIKTKHLYTYIDYDIFDGKESGITLKVLGKSVGE